MSSHIDSANRLIPYVPGSFHTAEHFEAACEDMRTRYGFQAMTLTIQTNKPENDFRNCAEQVRTAIYEYVKNAKVPVYDIAAGVFHSRAGNYGAWLLNMMDCISHAVFVAASFEPETLAPLINEKTPEMPERNTAAFRSGIKPGMTGPIMKRYDPAFARPMFFNLCSPDDADRAIDAMVEHRRGGEEPTLESWNHDVPVDYIYCLEDKIIRRDWQRWLCRDVLRVPMTPLYSDHSPEVFCPELLNDTIMELIENPGGSSRYSQAMCALREQARAYEPDRR